jgi:hypothetical protein
VQAICGKSCTEVAFWFPSLDVFQDSVFLLSYHNTDLISSYHGKELPTSNGM